MVVMISNNIMLDSSHQLINFCVINLSKMLSTSFNGFNYKSHRPSPIPDYNLISDFIPFENPSITIHRIYLNRSMKTTLWSSIAGDRVFRVTIFIHTKVLLLVSENFYLPTTLLSLQWVFLYLQDIQMNSSSVLNYPNQLITNQTIRR